MREGHPQRQPCSEGNAGTGFLKRGETDTTERRTQSGGNHTKKGMDKGLHGPEIGSLWFTCRNQQTRTEESKVEMAALPEGLLK